MAFLYIKAIGATLWLFFGSYVPIQTPDTIHLGEWRGQNYKSEARNPKFETNSNDRNPKRFGKLEI